MVFTGQLCKSHPMVLLRFTLLAPAIQTGVAWQRKTSLLAARWYVSTVQHVSIKAGHAETAVPHDIGEPTSCLHLFQILLAPFALRYENAFVFVGGAARLPARQLPEGGTPCRAAKESSQGSTALSYSTTPSSVLVEALPYILSMNSNIRSKPDVTYESHGGDG